MRGGLPVDPFTGSNQTWQVDIEEVPLTRATNGAGHRGRAQRVEREFAGGNAVQQLVAMGEYVCRVGNETGQVENQAHEALRKGNCGPGWRRRVTLSFRSGPNPSLSMRVGGAARGKIRQDDLLIFNQQFMTLSKSGLPLQKSLDMLARQTRSEQLRAAVEGVREKVQGGALLSEAFESTGKFPKIYCATLRAGERSGKPGQSPGPIRDLPEDFPLLPKEVYFRADLSRVLSGFLCGAHCFDRHFYHSPIFGALSRTGRSFASLDLVCHQRGSGGSSGWVFCAGRDCRWRFSGCASLAARRRPAWHGND